MVFISAHISYYWPHQWNSSESVCGIFCEIRTTGENINNNWMDENNHESLYMLSMRFCLEKICGGESKTTRIWNLQKRGVIFKFVSNFFPKFRICIFFSANFFVFILFGWDEEICMQIIWFMIYFHSFNYFSFERMKFISHLGRVAVLYQHFRWDQRKSIENRIEEPQISSKFTKCMFCVSAVGHSIKKTISSACKN